MVNEAFVRALAQKEPKPLSEPQAYKRAVVRMVLDEVGHALPDQIQVYRAIKDSGARRHGDIAKVVADKFNILEPK